MRVSIMLGFLSSRAAFPKTDLIGTLPHGNLVNSMGLIYNIASWSLAPDWRQPVMSAARRHSYYFWSPVLSKAYSVSLVIVLYLLFAAYNICATRPQTRRRSLANRQTTIWYMFLDVALACPTIGVAPS